MFAVGNAMSFVMSKWTDMSTGQVVTKILKRTLTIFLLGYLMYWFPFVKYDDAHNLILKPISETRIFGVLQRIALAYGATALMMYFLKPRLTTIITVLIFILYWPVMVYFGDSADPLSMQGNAVLRLDNWLIGTKHLYTGEGFPFDPEGLLSTLPSIGNVVAGYLVGSYLQKSGKSYEGLAKLLMAGVLCFIISYWWNLGFPINKKLWSSSFVMRTVGLDCMILACIIYLIDFLGKTKSVYFFQVFGRNPLPIYLLSEIGVIILFNIPVDQLSLFQWVYQNIFIYAGNYFASLLFAISWMLFCWVAGYILDKKKIYIKV